MNAGQSAAGRLQLNTQGVEDGGEPLSYLRSVSSSSFAADVAEHWQSEFLAVAAMTALSVCLRQRGSAESKPVSAPHNESSVSG